MGVAAQRVMPLLLRMAKFRNILSHFSPEFLIQIPAHVMRSRLGAKYVGPCLPCERSEWNSQPFASVWLSSGFHRLLWSELADGRLLCVSPSLPAILSNKSKTNLLKRKYPCREVCISSTWRQVLHPDWHVAHSSFSMNIYQVTYCLSSEWSN